jgi:hypothetical protein
MRGGTSLVWIRRLLKVDNRILNISTNVEKMSAFTKKTMNSPIQRWNRYQRLNPRLYDGLNSVNFCTSEVTLFEKKEPKSASRRLKS